MADDIEAFLKRAAQRRAAANVETAQPPPIRPAKPEFTNSRSERLVTPLPASVLVAEPVIEAEVVYDVHPAELIVGQADERMIQHVHHALDHQVGQLNEVRDVVRTAETSSDLDSILQLLRQPNGLRSAILLKEIFDPPTHRW